MAREAGADAGDESAVGAPQQRRSPRLQLAARCRLAHRSRITPLIPVGIGIHPGPVPEGRFRVETVFAPDVRSVCPARSSWTWQTPQNCPPQRVPPATAPPLLNRTILLRCSA